MSKQEESIKIFKVYKKNRWYVIEYENIGPITREFSYFWDAMKFLSGEIEK